MAYDDYDEPYDRDEYLDSFDHEDTNYDDIDYDPEIDETLDHDLFGYPNDLPDEEEVSNPALFNADGGLKDDPIITQQTAYESQIFGDYPVGGYDYPNPSDLLPGDELYHPGMYPEQIEANPLAFQTGIPPIGLPSTMDYGTPYDDFLDDNGIVDVLAPNYLGPIYWNDNLSLLEWQNLYTRNYICGIDPYTYRPYNVLAPYYWCFDYSPAEWDALYAANIASGGNYVKPIKHVKEPQPTQATATNELISAVAPKVNGAKSVEELTYFGKPLTPTQLKVRKFLDVHPVMTRLGKTIIYLIILIRGIYAVYQIIQWVQN
ncbi:hypothetical protein [Periweissella fabalis]|uniref:Uncharacterized protein n=1 Tax=Periweissella fabalis TaxID=1070421 RepID=A0A7X6S2H1_9LACO|nr:hypothetical protein [Periweissella fabalis]MCM0599259.1 hypothetical protein [Periweissella fabalis]NKZ23538.1 hypothetical protein [Periweissella fabalis]